MEAVSARKLVFQENTLPPREEKAVGRLHTIDLGIVFDRVLSPPVINVGGGGRRAGGGQNSERCE